ncbi:MAG TPA: hypothetical protein PKG54_02890 [Phycisphaerae bacterium]|jgi:predicted Zn-ribbon and HTH transcriptional regulator|nr:hypothetical protein [Phycisphaerae bacterium]HOB73450.1 hypothetical protein [Phycisphaerae bacterium]HOJ55977.1 hypothetical protein [Phycisphaerae bacterium]HOL25649.1 hypothetical protein [Phycisphaerae bacterium]HPP22111.1 hypothetical protein [Phycisphaerae bacterium]
MHWFWRAAIAVLAGVLGAGACFIVALFLASGRNPNTIAFRVIWLFAVASVFILSSVVAVAVHGRLIRRYGMEVRETRCRKCDYILRGISEPRCPECGERI